MVDLFFTITFIFFILLLFLTCSYHFFFFCKVVLKIIKHCQDEGSAGELVQGVLLGLIQNHKLEITNCFAFPSVRVGEDDDEDDGENLITCENK